MAPGSAFSPASVTDSVTEVTMLIHSTCTGSSGSVSPISTAARITRAWAPLAGSRNRMDLRMLA